MLVFLPVYAMGRSYDPMFVEDGSAAEEMSPLPQID